MAKDESPLHEIASADELWAQYQHSILRGIRPLFALEFFLGALGGWFVGRINAFGVISIVGAMISIAAGVVLGALFYKANMTPWMGTSAERVPQPRK